MNALVGEMDSRTAIIVTTLLKYRVHSTDLASASEHTLDVYVAPYTQAAVLDISYTYELKSDPPWGLNLDQGLGRGAKAQGDRTTSNVIVVDKEGRPLSTF